MTLENIEPELEEAVATLLAESVVTRLFGEIEKLKNVTNVDESWFKTVMDVIAFCGSIEVGFAHGRAFMLAIVKPKWDDLPFAVRKQFGLDFMSFARAVTGKEESTINNYINTANVWFINKVRPNGVVRIVERDVEGRPIMKADGTPVTKDVEFNPFMIDMSKLLAVNSRAAKGEMTDRIWEVLTDPTYDCSDVQKEHSVAKINGEMPDEYFINIGPGIYYKSGPDLVCVIEELNWGEYESDPLVKKGIDQILRCLHVKLDETYIYDLNRQKVVSAYANQGQAV